jgi:uncharacterized protein (DUF952 family)
MNIFHLVHEEQWGEAKDNQYYAPASLAVEGFIHCSSAHQTLRSANRFFAGSKELLVVEIDPESVESEIIFEDLYGSGVEHPHIYGKLPLSAVVAVHRLHLGEDGKFSELPPEIEKYL